MQRILIHYSGLPGAHCPLLSFQQQVTLQENVHVMMPGVDRRCLSVWLRRAFHALLPGPFGLHHHQCHGHCSFHETALQRSSILRWLQKASISAALAAFLSDPAKVIPK